MMIATCTASDKKSMKNVQGKYDFFVEIIEKSEPNFQNQTFIVNGYTNPDRKIQIPIQCKWYRRQHNRNYLQSQYTKNIYITSPLDIGFNIQAEVNSLDKKYQGTAYIDFGSIELDIFTKQELEAILSKGIGKFIVSIYSEEHVMQQNVYLALQINKMQFQLLSTSPDQQIDITYSLDSPLLDLSSKEPTIVQLFFREKWDYNRLCQFFKENPEEYPRIGIKFSSVGIKNLFILASRCFCTRNNLLNYAIVQDILRSEGLLQTENSVTDPHIIKKHIDITLHLSLAKQEIFDLISANSALNYEKQHLRQQIKNLEYELKKTIQTFRELVLQIKNQNKTGYQQNTDSNKLDEVIQKNIDLEIQLKQLNKVLNDVSKVSFQKNQKENTNQQEKYIQQNLSLEKQPIISNKQLAQKLPESKSLNEIEINIQNNKSINSNSNSEQIQKNQEMIEAFSHRLKSNVHLEFTKPKEYEEDDQINFDFAEFQEIQTQQEFMSQVSPQKNENKENEYKEKVKELVFEVAKLQAYSKKLEDQMIILQNQVYQSELEKQKCQDLECNLQQNQQKINYLENQQKNIGNTFKTKCQELIASKKEIEQLKASLNQQQKSIQTENKSIQTIEWNQLEEENEQLKNHIIMEQSRNSELLTTLNQKEYEYQQIRTLFTQQQQIVLELTEQNNVLRSDINNIQNESLQNVQIYQQSNLELTLKLEEAYKDLNRLMKTSEVQLDSIKSEAQEKQKLLLEKNQVQLDSIKSEAQEKQRLLLEENQKLNDILQNQQEELKVMQEKIKKIMEEYEMKIYQKQRELEQVQIQFKKEQEQIQNQNEDKLQQIYEDLKIKYTKLCETKRDLESKLFQSEENIRKQKIEFMDEIDNYKKMLQKKQLENQSMEEEYKGIQQQYQGLVMKYDDLQNQYYILKSQKADQLNQYSNKLRDGASTVNKLNEVTDKILKRMVISPQKLYEDQENILSSQNILISPKLTKQFQLNKFETPLRRSPDTVESNEVEQQLEYLKRKNQNLEERNMQLIEENEMNEIQFKKFKYETELDIQNLKQNNELLLRDNHELLNQIKSIKILYQLNQVSLKEKNNFQV